MTADPDAPRGDGRRPVRRLGWEDRPDGRVDVLRPKFGTGRVGRWLSARLARPHLRVGLDDLGSYVWRRCDGERTIADLVRDLEARGETGPDAAARLALFLDRMRARGLIDL